MPTEILFHKITIKRPTSNIQNDLGEQVFTYNTIYTDIPARVEIDRPVFKSKKQYRSSGQRAYKDPIIYVANNVTIQVRDQVFYPTSSTFFGSVSGVNPAIGPGGNVDHYELFIEIP